MSPGDFSDSDVHSSLQFNLYQGGILERKVLCFNARIIILDRNTVIHSCEYWRKRFLSFDEVN